MVVLVIVIIPLVYALIIFSNSCQDATLKRKKFLIALGLFFPSWIILSVAGVLGAGHMGFNIETEGVHAVWISLVICFYLALRLSHKLAKK